jgi:hypothetical protein
MPTVIALPAAAPTAAIPAPQGPRHVLSAQRTVQYETDRPTGGGTVRLAAKS